MDEWTWYHMFKRRFCKTIPAAWEAFYHSWLLSCSQPIRWWWCQVNSLVSASKWRGCHLYELWLMAKFLSFESTRLRSRNERESSTEEREQNFKDWAKKLNVFHSKKKFSVYSLFEPILTFSSVFASHCHWTVFCRSFSSSCREASAGEPFLMSLANQRPIFANGGLPLAERT